MTDVKLLEHDKKKGKCSFLIKGAPISFVNALRRSVIDYVPTMAIEDVEIRKNSSILYDEIIAHRLGLIPLTTDLKTYNLPSNCKCKGAGCARCTLKLILKAKGPCMVYASQLKSKDPKVNPVYPEMPLVKLLRGQDLELEATATLGIGKEHSKWSPGLAYYKHKPIVEILKKCDKCDLCVNACPKDIFEIKNNTLQVNKDNLYNCHLCGACLEACPKRVIKIGEKEDEFIFYLESWGQLSCKDIMKEAAACYDTVISDFIETTKSL